MKEYTLEQAIKYLEDNGLKEKEFFFNVYGWSTYYTLEPTFATPSGKHEDFPRSVMITRRGAVKPIKINF